jgi:tetratricopeptide (TPR) repeat protein
VTFATDGEHPEGNGSSAGADSVDALVRAALATAQGETASAGERAQMLMELAMGLQQRPKTRAHLMASINLYDAALEACPPNEALWLARIHARRATALQAVPEHGVTLIEQARGAYERAIPTLGRLGSAAEVAEAEMNLGLVLQYLAGAGRARITDAIAAYQRALRTFDAKRYPVEFALLQNNLATAYLAMPFTDERAKIREALAVQCFEESLKVVNLIEHPVEYAMLQNNLGNALQSVASGHRLENHRRAIAAYDEALKVRTRGSAPVEYANTLANKASCLTRLGDLPDGDRLATLEAAQACYAEAREIFETHGEDERARIVAEALAALESERATLAVETALNV